MPGKPRLSPPIRNHRPRMLIAAIWLLLAALAHCCWADERAAPRTIRVGSWNIQWLGQPERRPSQAPAQQAADLERYIRYARVDILALVEISDTDHDPGQYTNATLDELVERLQRGSKTPWRYLLFPKKDGLRPRDTTSQLTGVLWNTAKATLVGQPYRIPLDTADHEFDLWHRHPYAIKFSAGERLTDLVLVPLHLKSNYGRDRSSEKQRWIEAKRLTRALDDVRGRFADDDLVLAGDTNIRDAHERALSVFRVAGFRDLNSARQVTVSGGDAPFDRIFVPQTQPEFRDATQQVVTPDYLDREQFFQKLSDHYMVVVTVTVTSDDD